MDDVKNQSLVHYNLAFLQDTYDEIKALAKNQNVTIAEVLRQLLKRGLWLMKLQKTPDTKVIVIADGQEYILPLF